MTIITNTSDLVAILQQEREAKLQLEATLKKVEEEAASKLQDIHGWLAEMAPELTEAFHQNPELFQGLNQAEAVENQGEPSLRITGTEVTVSIRFSLSKPSAVHRHLAYCRQSRLWTGYGGSEILQKHSKDYLRTSVLSALYIYLGIDNGRK